MSLYTPLREKGGMGSLRCENKLFKLVETEGETIMLNFSKAFLIL